VHEDGKGLNAAQDMLPIAAGGGAPEDSDAALLFGLSEVAGNPGKEVRLLDHEQVLLG